MLCRRRRQVHRGTRGGQGHCLVEGWSGPLFGGGRCECFGPTEVIRAIFNGGRHECSEMIRANFVGGRYINAVSEVLRAALSEHSP